MVPTVVAALKGNHRHHRIAMVACGARHCVALSATCRVYTWGWNAFGQLGVGDTEPRIKPAWVQGSKLRRVAQVAAGWRHTVVMNEMGDVLAWGCTGAVRSGQLVHDPDKDNTHFQTTSPVEVPIHDTPGRHAISVCASASHTMAVTLAVYHQAPVDKARLHQALRVNAAARNRRGGASASGAGAGAGAGAGGASTPTGEPRPLVAREAAALVAEAEGDFSTKDTLDPLTTKQRKSIGTIEVVVVVGWHRFYPHTDPHTHLVQ